MRRKWLIILATFHVSECVLTLLVSCFLSIVPGNGLIWMSVSLSWWTLSGIIINALFWRWARLAGYANRFLTASHCMLGGLLWRMYLLKDADDQVGQDDEDTLKRLSILRLEVITLKTCHSFFQTYTTIFLCSRFASSSYLNPIMWFLITLNLAIIIGSTCLCVIGYVGDCVGDIKPNWLSVLEPSVIATNSTNPTSTPRSLSVIRFLVISQSFAFQVGRLVTVTSLSNLLGLALFFPVILIRLSVACFCLAKEMYAELGLTSWDLRRHGTAVCRLMYLSYCTLIDWHVNRDNQNGSNLVANAKTKRAVVYYALSATESVSVMVLWSLTSCGNVVEDDWFQGIRFAAIGVGCNFVSAVLIVIIMFSLRWDNARPVTSIQGFNSDNGVAGMVGCSNPTMDYSQNELGMVPEPNPKTASSYVDFKDLDDDEIVLFVASRPNNSGSKSTETTVTDVTSHIPNHVLKRANQKTNSRSCKMGLQSLLLRRDNDLQNNLAPVELNNRWRERRKSYDVTTMVSGAEFGLVVEEGWRLPLRRSQLSVESMNAPYARSIRTMSWPIIHPIYKATPVSQTVLPFKWESVQTPNNEVSGSRFEIPQITRDDFSDDVFYV